MAGSIDPRCETIRGTHWPVKVAGVFGPRVAENHLGQRPPTASTGRTYGCKRSDQTMKKLLRHGGRPHMSPEVRRHAFDPFFTTRRDRGSAGLGLHIVHNIVTNCLGGRLQLDSEPGEGTKMTIVLPRGAPATATDQRRVRPTCL